MAGALPRSSRCSATRARTKSWIGSRYEDKRRWMDSGSSIVWYTTSRSWRITGMRSKWGGRGARQATVALPWKDTVICDDASMKQQKSADDCRAFLLSAIRLKLGFSTASTFEITGAAQLYAQR